MDLNDLEIQIQYQFNNSALLQQAITHRSFSATHNERLEFLGDSILSAIISEYLYQMFPHLTEGGLTRLRSSLVNGESLAQLATNLALGQFLLLGKGEASSGGRERASILENTLEAIIGAIFLDSDRQTTKVVVLRWFDERLSNLTLDGLKNSKTALQEWLQAREYDLPVYQLAVLSGPAHQQEFTVTCQVNSLQLSATASGRSRKKAEQLAAELVFKDIMKQYE